MPWLLLAALQSFVYLAGLQLLLSSGKQSWLALAASTIAGVLYKSNFCNIKKLRVGGKCHNAGTQAMLQIQCWTALFQQWSQRTFPQLTFDSCTRMEPSSRLPPAVLHAQRHLLAHHWCHCA
jgi:hypothetical protein